MLSELFYFSENIITLIDDTPKCNVSISFDDPTTVSMIQQLETTELSLKSRNHLTDFSESSITNSIQ